MLVQVVEVLAYRTSIVHKETSCRSLGAQPQSIVSAHHYHRFCVQGRQMALLGLEILRGSVLYSLLSKDPLVDRSSVAGCYGYSRAPKL